MWDNMPVSEEELEMSSQEEPAGSTAMSKAELRKTHKPIMEKKRRARINHCLNEIKTLILEAMNKDPARHTKLEKADILEMAVKHLQNVQRQQLALAMASDPSVLRKFKNGFSECAREIDRFMDRTEAGLKQRVSNHLQKCIGGIDHTPQFNFPTPLAFGSHTSEAQPCGDQNNNPRISIPQGLQLIPSRLPTGELALLLPNSSSISYFPQNPRPSAFAAVVPNRSLSPPASPKHEGRAFKPVLPQQKLGFSQEDDHQVPQVTSTVPGEKQRCIQTIKFPITKDKRLESPRKLPEPLSTITNQSERYKLAQVKEDSANFEENIAHHHGVKRKLGELYQQSPLDRSHPAKLLKIRHEPSTSHHRQYPMEQNRETVVRIAPREVPKSEERQGSSRDNPEGGDSMWRPW